MHRRKLHVWVISKGMEQKKWNFWCDSLVLAVWLCSRPEQSDKLQWNIALMVGGSAQSLSWEELMFFTL